MGREHTPRELLGRAVATVRTEGVLELVHRSVPYLRRRRNRLWKQLLARMGGVPAARAYLRARRWVRPASITDTDPFARLWIDPARIDAQVRTTSKRWGRVVDGGWDRAVFPFDETSAYRSVVAHFQQGTPWSETAEFEQYRDRLEAGEQPKGCTTEDELEARFEELDAICDRIATDGYRSQPELWSDRPEYQRTVFYKWDRTIDPRLDEVTVSIGRDGRLLHSDRGDHRLAIAKLLECRTVPVLVRRRHIHWQSIRAEIAAATRPSDLTAQARRHLEHPDVRDLHEFELSATETETAATSGDRSPATVDE
ncbi:hypothetical protein [Natronorubrum bangense]|uniref:ParB-like nuclease n=1 Tax=Natronorubrum bangense JCM 10635 TaxID=1227500 RepID=L9WNP5_9EURY|nr:hypothetical protein [Natronorubrum bangense]ELY51079.1 hypothetical protein C494_04371 [Natronorubrum bangense JCM 10635]